MLVDFVLGVQLVQNMYRALKCIHTCLWNGSVRHLAMHRNFHLQAAVVSRDHLVAKACCNHEVGARMTMAKQPAWTFFAAKFFVVGKVQFHIALEVQWVLCIHGLQCAQSKGEGGKI